MSALFHMVASHGGSALLIVLALLVMATVVYWSARVNRRLADQATRLLYLALDGRADEARIQARGAGRRMRPVLLALGGEAEAPTARPLLRDFAAIALMSFLPVLLVVVDLQLLSAEPGQPLAAAIAAGLLVGLAVLFPAGMASALAVLELSRRSAREVRSACITLLSRTVKAEVEAEAAEALRRGANLRDPRGE